MKENLEFNLTHEMALQFIKFNEIKKELTDLKVKKILTKEDIVKINKLENELNKARTNFIKEFRENNKEEIIEYLKLKDQN